MNLTNKNLKNKKIGIVLSGGGMRAAIYHLGVAKSTKSP